MLRRHFISAVFSFILCYTAAAQKISYVQTPSTATAVLHKGLPKWSESTYFQNLPFTFEKDNSYIFFIRSNDFIPFITLYDDKTKSFVGTPALKETSDSSETRLSFTPEKDSTLFVILTSNFKEDTGKFSYGYYSLSPAQKKYSKDFSLCKRLEYLLNNWRTGWYFIPKKLKFATGKEDQLEFETTAQIENTLTLKGNATIFKKTYREIIYSENESILKGVRPDSLLGAGVYKKLVTDISNCLDASVWKKETEENSNGDTSTYFRYMDGKKREKEKSFELLLKTGSLLKPTEVEIIFY